MALVVVGVEGMIDLGEGSDLTQTLKKVAESLSWRLRATHKTQGDAADSALARTRRAACPRIECSRIAQCWLSADEVFVPVFLMRLFTASQA